MLLHVWTCVHVYVFMFANYSIYWLLLLVVGDQFLLRLQLTLSHPQQLVYGVWNMDDGMGML